VTALSPADSQAHEAVRGIAQKEATAPATVPVSEGRQPAASAAVRCGSGAGIIAAAPFVRRRLLQPALRMIHFDFASVDENGRQQLPQRASGSTIAAAAGNIAID
jgi:hypothetical protein